MGDQPPPFFVIGAGIMVLLIIFALIAGVNNNIANEEAKVAYEASLSQLRQDPTNASLRKRTIELGRAYSSASRNSKGIAYFDETALMNDISEACGGASVVVNAVNAAAPPVSSGPSLEERLTRLAQLKERELISVEEYQVKRQQLLDEL